MLTMTEAPATRMSADDLQMVRRRLGWTNPQIAAALGVRESTVKKWISGDDPIPFRVPLEIADQARKVSAEAEIVAQELVEKFTG